MMPLGIYPSMPRTVTLTTAAAIEALCFVCKFLQFGLTFIKRTISVRFNFAAMKLFTVFSRIKIYVGVLKSQGEKNDETNSGFFVLDVGFLVGERCHARRSRWHR